MGLVPVLILLLPAYLVFWQLLAWPEIDTDFAAEINRLTRPDPYEADDNAAGLYDRACELTPPHPGSDSPCEYAWPGDLSAEDKERLRAWLRENEPAFDCLREAAQKPVYWPPLERPSLRTGLIEQPMPHSEQRRQLVSRLQWRAMLAADEGRLEEAVDDLAVCLRIASHCLQRKNYADWSDAMDILRATACDAILIMEKKSLPPELLEKLQAELTAARNNFERFDMQADQLLARDLVQHSFAAGSRGRFIPRTLMNKWFINSGEFFPAFESSVKRFDWDLFLHIWRRSLLHDRKAATLAKLDTYYDNLNSAYAITPWQLHEQKITYHDLLQDESLRENNFLLSCWMIVSKMLEVRHRALATQSAAIGVCALHRCRARRGEYPESLGQLVEWGYLEAAPADPYSGGVLVYRLRPDGAFTLYSLDDDFTDNGGRRKPEGTSKEKDMVFWPDAEFRTVVEFIVWM